jgi:hypothetical protein
MKKHEVQFVFSPPRQSAHGRRECGKQSHSESCPLPQEPRPPAGFTLSRFRWRHWPHCIRGRGNHCLALLRSHQIHAETLASEPFTAHTGPHFSQRQKSVQPSGTIPLAVTIRSARCCAMVDRSLRPICPPSCTCARSGPGSHLATCAVSRQTP